MPFVKYLGFLPIGFKYSVWSGFGVKEKKGFVHAKMFESFSLDNFSFGFVDYMVVLEIH